MGDIISFDDGADARPKEAVPWGVLAWCWAAALIVPPVGIIVCAVVLAVMWSRRSSLAGLWVPAAGLFTSLALTVALSLYFLHGMEIEARQKAEYLGCRQNVELLAAKIADFRASEGRPPATLEEIAPLMPEGILPVCPAHAGDGTGYTYDASEWREGEGYRIVLYDSEPRHRGCRLILRSDGRIEWFAEATFRQLQSNPADCIREAMERRRSGE